VTGYGWCRGESFEGCEHHREWESPAWSHGSSESSFGMGKAPGHMTAGQLSGLSVDIGSAQRQLVERREGAVGVWRRSLSRERGWVLVDGTGLRTL